MTTMQDLSVKDLVDAFSGAKDAARDAADDGMMAPADA